MTDPIPSNKFADDPEFLRRAMSYLERSITPDDLKLFEWELLAEPLNRKTLVAICMSRTELKEKFRKETAYHRDLLAANDRPDSGAESPELNDANTAPVLSSDQALEQLSPGPSTPAERSRQTDPFLILLARAGRGKLHEPGASAELGAPGKPAPEKAKSGQATAPSRWKWRLAAAILLPLFAATALWQTRRPSNLATLALVVDAQWGQADANLKQSDLLPRGPHTLDEGFAEVKLTGGAIVVLQAPIRFEILSDSRIMVSAGRLTATVPHGGAGLTVETPDVVAVDLGTEFAVDVQPGVLSHVEVFRGRVRAEIPAANGRTPASQTVGMNEAVAVSEGSSAIEHADPTPFAFVRSAALDARAKSPGAGGYERWQQFTRKLRTDPDLEAYYLFDNQDTAPDRLLNRATGTAGKHDGSLGVKGGAESRPVWWHGRWPEKGALKFGGGGPTAVRIPADPKLVPADALTIEFWFKRAVAEQQPVHMIHSAVENTQQFDLSLTGILERIEPKRKRRALYFDWATRKSEVNAPYILPAAERWTFVAVTAIRDGSTQFYVDGELLATRPTGKLNQLTTGDLLIGMPAPCAKADPNDIFHGRMDELAIFRRALTPEEIKQMYVVGSAP